MDTARTNEAPGIWSWSVGGISPPDVHFNAGTDTFFSDGGTFPPGSLWVCPGPEGTVRNLGVMRFTVPANAGGDYRIDVAAEPYLGEASGNTDFHVVRNGTALLSQQLSPRGRASYLDTLTLAAGETIDLAVGRGQDGLLVRSCLKLRAVFTRLTDGPPPPASCQPLVVPGAFAGVEAGGGTSVLRDAIRLQEVYGAGQFPTQPIVIRELRWRPSAIFGSAFTGTIANLQINLSTTARQPDGLSAMFAENVGPNDTVVFSGPIELRSQFVGPAGGPKAFDMVVPLRTPFVYDPARGNLLVDVRNHTGGPVAFVDGGQRANDQVSRAFALGANSVSATSLDSGADAIEICYTSTNAPPPPVAPGLVVPNELAGADTAFGSGTLSNPAYRSQQVYGASEFSSVSGAILITELRYRPDYFYGGAFSTTISNIQFNLSTTTRTAEALSSVFADNVGADDAAAFSGPLSVSSSFSGPTGGPKAFDIIVPLTTPFVYNPAAGNLLVDIRNFSGSSASLLSGQGVIGDGVSRVGGSVNSLSGTPDNGADALAIVYVSTNVPPPPPPPPTNCVAVPSGLVSWWRGDGDASDSVGANHGTLVNGAGFAAGKVGQGFSLNGSGEFVLIPDRGTLDLTNALTVELWFKADDYATARPLFDKRDGAASCNYGAIPSTEYGLQLYYNDPQVNDGDFPGSGFVISAHQPAPAAGVFHHFAGTYRQVDATHVELNTYVDGALVRSRTFQGSLARTANNAPLSIGAEGAGAGAVFKGVIDEVALYNRALTASEIHGIHAAGAAGKCPVSVPPTARFTITPLCVLSPNQTDLLVLSPNNTNATVVFDASAFSDPQNDQLQYFWSIDGEPTPFATGVLTTNVFSVGSHTVTLTVSDGATSGSTSLQFDVITLSDAVGELMTQVNQSILARGTKRSLLATLKATGVSFDRGNSIAGANQLGAFQNKVRARVASSDATLAGQLTQAALKIIDAASAP